MPASTGITVAVAVAAFAGGIAGAAFFGIRGPSAVSLQRARTAVATIADGRVSVKKAGVGPAGSGLTPILVRSNGKPSLMWLTDGPHPYAIVGHVYAPSGEGMDAPAYHMLANGVARARPSDQPRPRQPQPRQRLRPARPSSSTPAPSPRPQSSSAAHDAKSASHSGLFKDATIKALRRRTKGIVWASSSATSATPEIVLFFDPNCTACHTAYEQIKPLVTAGKLRVYLIPVGFLTHSSRAKAIAILTAASPLQAYLKDERHFSPTSDNGGIKAAASTTRSERHDVHTNTVMLAAVDGGKYLDTPTYLVPAGHGEWRRVKGVLSTSRVQHIIGESHGT